MKEFSPRHLFEALQHLPPMQRYWVAYSGGHDSHVLLHALAALRDRLAVEIEAIHIDHGLQAESSRWAAHCQTVCAQLKVPFQLQTLNVCSHPGQSPEDAARTARYQAFADHLAADECLLTAHHQEDQAETLLLQLLRGSGPAGLAAMPVIKPFASGWLARPLLNFARSALHAYARQHELQWIEDPTNVQTHFDRNYLRQNVWPVIQHRWPAAAATISRSASLCAETAELVDAVAAHDMATISTEHPDIIRIPPLLGLDKAQQNNVLRYWVRSLALPLPHQVHIDEIRQQLLTSKIDSNPRVCWPGAEVRRYRQQLYAMPPIETIDKQSVYQWTPPVLDLPSGQLKVSRQPGQGLKVDAVDSHSVTVRWRRGGEKLCLGANRPQHELKKLFQEQGIPPWQRDQIPLIYIEDQLAAVAGLWYALSWRAAEHEEGYVFHWNRHNNLA